MEATVATFKGQERTAWSLAGSVPPRLVSLPYIASNDAPDMAHANVVLVSELALRPAVQVALAERSNLERGDFRS